MTARSLRTLLLAIALVPLACGAEGVTGTVKRHEAFPSKYVDPRNVDVWLPPSYDDADSKKYPVLYIHDGQNLFDPTISFGGVDWNVDEVATRLIREARMREAIVVGIWNTPKRFQEYMPEAPYELFEEAEKASFVAEYGSPPLADEYLRFMVEELKPFIDTNYKTLSGRENTFVMGSSMGGLISLYAISRYPGVFGGAGCVSTHWPVSLQSTGAEFSTVIIDYFARALPKPGSHRIYFDYGTETLDASYEPHQQRMDEVMASLGYVQGENWVTRKFPGAEHSERSWRERVEIPLVFLLGT